MKKTQEQKNLKFALKAERAQMADITKSEFGGIIKEKSQLVPNRKERRALERKITYIRRSVNAGRAISKDDAKLLKAYFSVMS